MENIEKCQICGNTKIDFFIECIDFTVSHDKFKIQRCSSCGFKFTSPRPYSSDIGRYYKSESYISHSNTKKGIVNRAYHVVRSYTLIKKLQLLMHYSVKKGSVIDYGCGSGSFLKTCKENGWSAYGFDPSPDAREFIKTKFSIDAFSSQNELVTHLSGSKVDCITMWHVLEHVGNFEELFLFFESSLRSKGKLFIAVPNPESFDANYYKEFWAAYDLPRHFSHFSPKDIKALFSKNGYKHIKTLPMIFDSFYVSMLSEKYKGSRLGIFKAFFVGLWSNIVANKSGERFSSQIYIFEKA